MLTLDPTGEFISTSTLGGISAPTPLGVIAKKKSGRWQYRDIETKRLYASGMEPGDFAKRFWYRDDYAAAETLV